MAKKAAPAAKTTGKPKAKPKKAGKRLSWLSKTNSPVISKYAKKMQSYAKAMADGVITDQEVKEQEARLSDLLKGVESELDDELHAKVTELLCELTVYDMLQMLHSLQTAKPQGTFRG